MAKIRGIRKRKESFQEMMRTLLIQNQQIIMQQQNMMFMILKQTHQQPHQQQQHHQQQVTTTYSPTETHINAQQEDLGNYLTPAQSEQDPINVKDDDLVALLENDGLLQNNLLYNPQTDIGQITPYKSHQTPSYYSSGCESLTTPRVDQQTQPTTSNINQAVVKNLADSFKSPTKPKINIQIMSGSATGSMKNSKAKIIQRMNISEFLRHVHPETDESAKNGSQ